MTTHLKVAVGLVSLVVGLGLAACAPPPPGPSISGRVVDPVTGLPVAGVTMVLGDTASTPVPGGVAVTGADGRFVISDVAAEESSLHAGGKAGYEEGFVGCSLGFNLPVVPTFGEACTFPTGDLGDIDLDELRSFSGRVLDSVTRLPVAGAYVTPADTTPTLLPGTTVLTDAEGRFTIPDLPGDEYGVQVEKANYGYEIGFVTCPSPTTGEHQVDDWGGSCTFPPMDLGVVLLDPVP